MILWSEGPSFKFSIYEDFFTYKISMSICTKGPSIKYITLFLANFDPSVTNCHTFSDPLPLEHDVLYGRPQTIVGIGVDLSKILGKPNY